MKKKKVLALILTSVMVAGSLSGCGDAEESQQTGGSGSQESTQEESSQESSQESEEDSSEESGEAQASMLGQSR